MVIYIILKKNAQQVDGERLIRWYTKFDFTVDEGKDLLNPSREKNKDKHRRRPEGGEILCDLPPV